MKKIAFSNLFKFTASLALAISFSLSATASQPDAGAASDTNAAPTSRQSAQRKETPTLASSALAQIAAIDNDKAARTPAQQKIQSTLIYAARMQAGLDAVPGVPTLETGVTVSGASKVLVDIRAEVTPKMLRAVQGAGGEIVSSLAFAKTIQAWLPLSSLETLAADERVFAIRVPREASTDSAAPPVRVASAATATERQANVMNSLVTALADGKIQSEPTVDASTIAGIRAAIAKGDIRHGARRARAVFGVDGTGLKIGVISNSFNAAGGYAADILSGDLPGAGNPNGYTLPVLFAGSGDYNATGSGADEGRAMAEIVHAVLPGAQIYFASAFRSQADFANNILALRGLSSSPGTNGNVPNGGCDIIVDDVGYDGESALHDGQKNLTTAQNIALIKQAVNDVTANGCLYFSSASNAGNLDSGTSGTWEGDFNSGGASTAPFPTGGLLNNWVTSGGTPSTLNTITTVGNFLGLEWSDLLGAASVDYDLYVTNAAGTAIVAASTDTQNGTGVQDPLEYLNTRTGAVVAGTRIAVLKKSTTSDIRFLSLASGRGVLQYATDGQTRGHSTAPNAFGVAATPVDATTGPTFPAPFSAANGIETFSSDGKRRVFYGETNNVLGNGTLTVSTGGGVLRQKPDLTAADGAPSTVNTGGLNPFFGTSAAAPHAAAISGLIKAALLKSGASQPDMATIRNILTSTAVDILAAGPDRDSGFGIVQAFQALQTTGLTAGAGFDLGTIAATEGTGANGNGFIEPGETANLNIPLANVGLSTAFGVTATLSTTTSGVTILSGTRTYPDTAAAATSNNSVPFSFALGSSFPCTGAVNFKLTVSYTGAGAGVAPQSLYFRIVTGPPTTVSLTSNLDSTPPVSGPLYTASTGFQTNGRLASGRAATTCAVLGSNALNTTIQGNRQYDAYTFMNNGPGRCISVTFSAPLTNGNANPDLNTSMDCAAYSAYNPAAPASGFLGDLGGYLVSTTTPLGGQSSFSFNAPANAPFTLVVVERNPGVAGSSPTNFNVYGIDVSNLSAQCASVNSSQVDVSDVAPVVITSTSFVASTCSAQGYSTDIVVNATVTNNSSSTLQGVNFQVAQLSTSSGAAGTPPYRLLTASDASCTTGGQVGSVQPLAAGSLAPGATAALQFRIAAPSTGRFRFGVRTLANSPSFSAVAPAAGAPALFELNPSTHKFSPVRAKPVKLARVSGRKVAMRR